MANRVTYITWHYTNHGAAYFKHVLSAFHRFKKLPTEINLDQLDQEELHLEFDDIKDKGFLFDEVIYLTANQAAFDGLSTRRHSYKTTILDDELVKSSGLLEIFSDLLNQDFSYQLLEEVNYVEKNYPDKLDDFKSLLWRNIQHYPIEEQIYWLKNLSNFPKAYCDRLRVVSLEIDNLRDEKQIAQKLGNWVKKDLVKGSSKTEFIINVSLGSSETQVVWHILAEAGKLPDGTRFIKTYDDKKDNPESRFKRFSIQETPVNLISKVSSELRLYENPKSEKRRLVNEKFSVFLETGFAIFLLGERGTGKSKMAKECQAANTNLGSVFIEANCASFADDDKAEAELFGYGKGTFTDQLRDGKKGLIEEANDGVLFLDEVHLLSERVQGKLMKAFQTDDNNMLKIQRKGETKEIAIKCSLVFASNKSVKDLRNHLLPDFYDRVVQHVIEIPPLRETPEDRRSDFEAVWRKLKFPEDHSALKDEQLMSWLTTLPLYGNYRDLQKVAMYYKVFEQFAKTEIEVNSALAYAKREFEKYHSIHVEETSKFNFSRDLTTNQMIVDYRFELQKWAVDEFGGIANAVRHLNTMGDTVTLKTFNNWKNKVGNK